MQDKVRAEDVHQPVRHTGPGQPTAASSEEKIIAPGETRSGTKTAMGARRKEVAERRYGEGLPPEVASVVRFLTVGALVASVVWGPAYYACRQTKEQGQLYYGTTVNSCVREKMAENQEAIEATGRDLWAGTLAPPRAR